MTVEQITSGYRKISALVVGGICLDRRCTYDPATSEPSRETGIPRIGVVKTEVAPGAGGTVAPNLVALGASRVAVLGVACDDGHGHELLGSLRTSGISADLMVTGTPAVRRLPTVLAIRPPRKIFWADSRKHVHEFRNVIVKPNRVEADVACTRLFGQVCYQKLRQHAETALMVVALGGEGALLVEPGRVTPVDTAPVEKPVDIRGAGDSFSAGGALAVTGSPVEAARFGNLAVSITIMKRGTGAASLEEVLAAASARLER